MKADWFFAHPPAKTLFSVPKKGYMLSVGNLGVCATSANEKIQFVRGVNKSWESMTDHLLCSCTSACMFREWSSRHWTFTKKTNRRLYFVLFGTGSCESWPRTPPALCSRCCDAQSMQLLNKKNGVDACCTHPRQASGLSCRVRSPCVFHCLSLQHHTQQQGRHIS